MKRAPRLRRSGEDEQGFVLVFFAIMLVLLLALAGFIVDFSNWQLQGTKIQRAADAAALAGAVFLPDSPDQAKAVALETAARNGYTSGVDPQLVPGHVDQLQVSITATIRNYFAQVVGMRTKDITKTSIATYQKPIAMGSPSNQFGNDPDSCAGAHGTTCYPDFWANVAGKASDKVSGDRYTAGVCSSSPTPDRCPSDYATSSSGGDYDSFGNVFAIEVKQAGNLAVQVFDPGFADVGDHCEKQNTALAQMAALAPRFGLNASHYGAGDTNAWCTGDNYFGSSPGSEPKTVYTVRSPGPLPPDPGSSPTTCTTTFAGIPSNDNLATDFQLNNHPVVSAGATYGFRDYFRRWVPVCTISAAAPGTYFLQVQGPSGEGHNRFAVRATGVSANVYGFQHMAIYANAPSANTTFYLARVPSSAKNHTLVVDLYDIGDAADGSVGTLTILPPTEWSGSFGGSSAPCTFRKGVGGSVNAVTGCAVGNVSSANGYNGKIDEFQVPIPSTYSCSDAVSSGCWVKIRLAFSGDVQDTTTWSAYLDGDPVRIVK